MELINHKNAETYAINQRTSIYIVYISVLLVVFHMMNEGYKLYL
jgi:hypothetical protein